MKRKTLYPKFVATPMHGVNAIVVKLCKELLGWQEEKKDEFGDDFLLKVGGVKIRCTNNITNRPIYKAVYETLQQEILRGMWQFNGEPIIIGKTGLILNGQHTLIALILAVREWGTDKDKWPEWKKAPTMEKLIVYGIDESDKTVNTMDTCKPRSIADVIFRSNLFQDVQPKDRKKIAAMTGFAVKLLWHRTAAKLNAFAPIRTHAESLDFIARHPGLLGAVKFIHTECEGTNISRYISPGYASALLYLMGSSTSSSEKYVALGHCEDGVGFDNWDKASDFWVGLAGDNTKFRDLRNEFIILSNKGEATHDVRCALIAKAWLAWVDEKTISPGRIALKFDTDADGFETLAECPTVGGIDVGGPDQVVLPTKEETPPESTDPTPSEIKERAKAERDKAKAKAPKSDPDPKPKTKAKPRKKKRPRDNDQTLVGKIRWVREEDDGCWSGHVESVTGKICKIKVDNGHQGAGNIRAIPVAMLLAEQPTLAPAPE